VARRLYVTDPIGSQPPRLAVIAIMDQAMMALSKAGEV
jgi:hypothetical protein